MIVETKTFIYFFEVRPNITMQVGVQGVGLARSVWLITSLIDFGLFYIKCGPYLKEKRNGKEEKIPLLNFLL